MAQSKWKWPADTAKAKENWVLLTDDIKAKNYDDALNPFGWLYENAPNLNKSLYINGVKMYKNLAKKVTDDVTKAKYQEQVMKLYDQRMEFFGEPNKVIGYKALDAYSFYKGDPEKIDFILGLIEEAYKSKKEKTSPTLLTGWIQMYYLNKRKNKVEYTEEQVFDVYGKIMAAFETQKESASERRAAALARAEMNVNKLLNGLVKIDCEFIQKSFVPKFEENPEDLKTAEYIVSLSIQAGCTKEPYFLKALQLRHKHAPTFGMANTIAKQLLSAGRSQEALPYIDEAIELATDDAKKGQAILYKAEVYREQGMKAKARATIYEAMKLNSELKKNGFTLIGNMYLGSYKECKGGRDIVQDRAIYIAAYYKFKKAGNTKMMAKCKEQFPSAVEIFEKNKKVGDPIHIGCWVNETVKLEKRP
ncbi:MAG: tetratricopeptide repeat protein [Cytophagales bacterium]|nr:tetratricopeptide repeat protein [Cytophagales bacterium]